MGTVDYIKPRIYVCEIDTIVMYLSLCKYDSMWFLCVCVQTVPWQTVTELIEDVFQYYSRLIAWYADDDHSVIFYIYVWGYFFVDFVAIFIIIT